MRSSGPEADPRQHIEEPSGEVLTLDDVRREADEIATSGHRARDAFDQGEAAGLIAVWAGQCLEELQELIHATAEATRTHPTNSDLKLLGARLLDQRAELTRLLGRALCDRLTDREYIVEQASWETSARCDEQVAAEVREDVANPDEDLRHTARILSVRRTHLQIHRTMRSRRQNLHHRQQVIRSRCARRVHARPRGRRERRRCSGSRASPGDSDGLAEPDPPPPPGGGDA